MEFGLYYRKKKKKEKRSLFSFNWGTNTVKKELSVSQSWEPTLGETMKRFFQPVEKDGSAKKPALSPSKKDDDENGGISDSGTKKEPLKFLTWNANSFLLRVKNNWPEFTNFVTSFDPDVIAIQVSSSFSTMNPFLIIDLFS